MQKKNKYWILAGFFVFFIACFGIQAQEVEYVPGRISVKLDREAAFKISPRLRSGQIKSASPTYVQTGISGLDAVLKQAKTIRLRRLLPYSQKYEERYRAEGLDLWYELEVEEANILQIVKNLASQQGILLAEPVYPIKQASAANNDYPFNDPHIGKQWSYNNTGFNPESGLPAGTAGTDINLYKAWEITAGSPNVVVAIMDAGVDVKHPDLVANLWVNTAEKGGASGVDDDGNGYIDDIHGHDFVNHNLTIEASDHGTHVAGTVAATNNNGIGVAGVAGGTGKGDGARIMSCQVMTANGASGDIFEAFVYAANNGAVIAQCSWAWMTAGYKNQAVLDGIDYFVKYAGKDSEGNPLTGTPMNGGLVVFAAGNNGFDDAYYPAYYEKCYAVAAVNIDKERAVYSNYGSWIDITAPGGWDKSPSGQFGNILSTRPHSAYGYDFGTSMACPHVSGVAALILSKYGNGNFTPEMLKQRISSTARVLTSDPGKMGAGFVDAFAALSSDIPDAEANLYFGSFLLEENNDGSFVTYEQPFRILNSGSGEMVISAMEFSSNQYTITGFTAGQKLKSGEYADFTVRFTPTAVGGYKDKLTVTYGGSFSGKSTETFLHANITGWATTRKVVLFKDDFERGMYKWSSSDQDGDRRNWFYEINSSYILAKSGSFFVTSESGSSTESYTPNNWLISPVIDLTECPENSDVALSYWVRIISSTFGAENYKVAVSTVPEKDFAPADFSNILISEAVEPSDFNDGYNHKTVSLSAFSGKKIKIAFIHAETSPSRVLVLDDVEVAHFPKQDFAQVVINKMVSPGYEIVKGANYPLTISVSNIGNLTAQNVEVAYTFGQNSTVKGTIPTIAAGKTVSYTFSTEINADMEGENDLLIEANCPANLFKNSDNVKNWFTGKIWINPYPAEYTWDFERTNSQGLYWPSNFTKFNYDKNTVDPFLKYTSWGAQWPSTDNNVCLANYFLANNTAFGQRVIVSASYFKPQGKANRGFIIDVPEVKADKVYLKWTARSFSEDAPESYQVLIAAEDVSDVDGFTLLKTVTNESRELTSHLIDVSQYANKPFRVAFRQITENGLILLWDNISILSSSASSINPEVQTDQLLVYPNPAKDRITIRNTASMNQLRIVDLKGRTLMDINNINKEAVEVNISAFEKGIYIVYVDGKAAKIIKQ